MRPLLSILFSLLGTATAFPQGFVNFNFESCTLNTNAHAIVPVGEAFPGWTVYAGGVVQSQIAYNASLTGQSYVGLNSTAMSFPALFGNYNPRLHVNSADSLSVALGQVGQIPIGTSSLQFMTANVTPVPAGGLTVTFAGSPLSLVPLGLAPSYTLWTADISAFAGLTGELRFTGNQVGGTWATYLDDIAFLPVPEPSTWALLALGSALFAGAARRRRALCRPGPAAAQHQLN